MISTVAVIWVTMTILGNICLLLLLGTFYVVKTLPQRKNPFLVNMVLTSYFASIPPLMLLFTGQQERISMQWVCILQSACMDSIAPMFSFALAALVFQLWSELRAIVRSTTCVLSKYAWLYWTLLVAPYILFLGWFTASLTGALSSSARVGLGYFVFCVNQPLAGDPLRTNIGYFTGACMIVSIILEVWIAFLVLPLLRCSRMSRKSSSIYHAEVHMWMRLLLFSLIQLIPIFLTVLNHSADGLMIRYITEILESMYSMTAFFVFGTQKTVLQAWKVIPQPALVGKSGLV